MVRSASYARKLTPRCGAGPLRSSASTAGNVRETNLEHPLTNQWKLSEAWTRRFTNLAARETGGSRESAAIARYAKDGTARME